MFDPYFWAVGAAAVFIIGLSKSGLIGSVGIVGVPMLTLVMAPREAAGVMLPVLLIMDAFAIYTYRKDFDWHNLSILLPGALTGIVIGWLLSSSVTDDMVLLGVGVITLVFVADAVLPFRKKLEGLPPSRPWGTFWGGLAGFTSFVAHAGGPPFQVFVLPQKLSPATYAGTTAWFFALVNAIKLIPYYFLGQLSVGNLQLSFMLAPFAIAGVLLGIYLVRRISAKLFYQIAYVLVFFLGLKLTYDGITGIFLSA